MTDLCCTVYTYILYMGFAYICTLIYLSRPNNERLDFLNQVNFITLRGQVNKQNSLLPSIECLKSIQLTMKINVKMFLRLH